MNFGDILNPQLLCPLLLGTLGILLIVAVYLLWAFFNKKEIIRKLKEENEKLMSSFNDLDEQAKSIIQTDLELAQSQEKLDKRFIGLNAIQKVSHQISQALNESEIFQKIPISLFESLGFAHALIASVDSQGHWRVRFNAGFHETFSVTLLKKLESSGSLNSLLKGPATLSSINITGPTRETLIETFESIHFVFSPILIQNGKVGFVFAGNPEAKAPVVQSDEELISILAGQIGQAMENAQLFEKVFRSTQEMELKVKERTKQLAQALEKVEDISKKKSEFISAVSHELRTPLTSIKGYASLLMAGKIGDIPPAVKERLAKINTHSDNLVGLINNLLDIARIESGRQEMKFNDYKTKAIIDNIIDLLNPQMTTKGLKWQLIIPAEINAIYADNTQVDRVFINLVSNAIKFTPSGGTITIKASSVLDKGYVIFNVTDTGIGIPADDVEKLFSEFFRVDNEINKNVQGTGLGLVLAKNIIEAHGGKIWLQSKPGSGTTFYFTLPSSEEAFNNKKRRMTNTS